MATEIEKVVYRDGTTHAVVQFWQSADRLVVSIAPWTDLDVIKTATFADVKLISLETYHDDAEQLNLPWDIIGFDSLVLPNRMWRFCLHCDAIEYGFEARWPVLSE